MALDINSIVNVQVNLAPKAAANRGFGQFLIIGASKVIPADERIRYYNSLDGVGSDFGTDSPEYKAALTYFAQSPTPNDLAIGYWDNGQKGTMTVINGGYLEDIRNAFIKGAMKFTADGATYDFEYDLSKCTTLEQAAEKINEKLVKEGTGTEYVPRVPEVPATAASLSIKYSNPEEIVSAVKALGAEKNGMKITTNKGEKAFAPGDGKFKSCNNMTDIVGVLNGGQTDIVFAWNNDTKTLTATAKDTGVASTIAYAKAHTSDGSALDELNTTLKLTQATGCILKGKGTALVPEVPAKPAVPVEYFAKCVVSDNSLDIVPINISTVLTLPVKSVKFGEAVDLSKACKFATDAGGSLDTVSVRNETVEDVLSILADKSQTWYACMFAETLSNDEVVNVAKLVEALSPVRLFGVTLQDPNEKTTQRTLGSRLKELGLKRTMCQFDPDNKFAIASYIGRLVTTNFLANNSVITMKFKQEPTVASLDLSTTEAKNLTSKNINFFAKYTNDTAIIQEGTQASGAWSDEVIGLDWLQNYVQNAVYNVLYTSTNKIPQTNDGLLLLKTAVSGALAQAARNGLLAERIWNGPTIGNIVTGSLLNNGFRVFSENIENQSQADREARKAPVIQVACTLSGAFHFADVVINVVR